MASGCAAQANFLICSPRSSTSTRPTMTCGWLPPNRPTYGCGTSECAYVHAYLVRTLPWHKNGMRIVGCWLGDWEPEEFWPLCIQGPLGDPTLAAITSACGVSPVFLDVEASTLSYVANKQDKSHKQRRMRVNNSTSPSRLMKTALINGDS